MRPTSALLLTLAFAASAAAAAEPATTTTLYALTDTGVGDPIGSITFKNGKSGLLLLTKLAGLPPGAHGIHLHQNADCSALAKDGQTVPGLAAGGHFDPAKAGKHLGPTGDGHKGDLPVLKVAANGTAHERLVAPHLTLADISGHAVIIHAGGDNYSDEPKPLGGGGARIACGVVQ
jgi:Cu-Zn family superoxide dismutase